MSPTHPPVEPFSPGFADDPYPTFAWLREHSPVHRVVLPFAAEPIWLVTRYEDVRTVLADPRFGNDSEQWADPAIRESGLLLFDNSDLTPTMSMVDPPEHTRLRRAVGHAFTSRRVAAVRTVVDRTIDEVFRTMAALDSCDLLETLAAPLSLVTLCEFVGVPAEDRLDLRGCVDRVLSTDPAERRGIPKAVAELEDYFDRLIRHKRARPSQDLISDLVLGGRLPAHEVKPMVFMLLAAGLEGAMNLVGNGVLTLLDHPDQLTLLRQQPELSATAVEEVLRYECPAAAPLWRFPKTGTVLSGKEIPAGALVVASLNSANRDPNRFPEPDRFDINRPDTGHLAFGHGPRQCMGAALVRMQGRLVLQRLVTEFPELALATDRAEVRFQPEILTRGLSSLPVAPGRRRVGAR